MKKIQNYINGKFIASLSRNYINNIDPSTSGVYSLVPDSDVGDVQLAVDATKVAFPTWSTCGIKTRANILNKIAALIEDNLEELARVESIDNGKPISLARALDIPRASSSFRFYASGIQHFATESTTWRVLQSTTRSGRLSGWRVAFRPRIYHFIYSARRLPQP